MATLGEMIDNRSTPADASVARNGQRERPRARHPALNCWPRLPGSSRARSRELDELLARQAAELCRKTGTSPKAILRLTEVGLSGDGNMLTFTMPTGSAFEALRYTAPVASAVVYRHGNATFGYTIPKGLAGLHIVVKLHDGGFGFKHDTFGFGVATSRSTVRSSTTRSSAATSSSAGEPGRPTCGPFPAGGPHVRPDLAPPHSDAARAADAVGTVPLRRRSLSTYLAPEPDPLAPCRAESLSARQACRFAPGAYRCRAGL